MLYKSIIITKGSGAIGGLVFSHNKGGPYIRERAQPTNPNSIFQQVIRAAMSSLAIRWQDTLTAVQRTAWELYAANVAMTNRVGDSIFLTGLNHYIRSNVPRIQATLPRVDAAPVIFNLGTYTPPSFAIDEPNDEVDVTFENADAWANEDDAGMIVYCSLPRDETINYFKGPYRYSDKVSGDSITPPTSPAAMALPAAIASGQRNFFRAVVSRADGRLSYDFRSFADAA